MNRMGSAIVLIILGLIVMAFPLLGVVPAAVITGFVVLIFGLGLLLSGIYEMEENMGVGLAGLILGIIALVLGIGIIINPALFSFIAGFLVFIVGFFLLLAGIMALLMKDGDGKWSGIAAIVIGILYMIVGNFVSNPIYLGILIAIWLLITGILMLFQKD
jgi:uncharacterized membrane protein HdeD (DUF308 family)